MTARCNNCNSKMAKSSPRYGVEVLMCPKNCHSILMDVEGQTEFFSMRLEIDDMYSIKLDIHNYIKGKGPQRVLSWEAYYNGELFEAGEGNIPAGSIKLPN